MVMAAALAPKRATAQRQRDGMLPVQFAEHSSPNQAPISTASTGSRAIQRNPVAASTPERYSAIDRAVTSLQAVRSHQIACCGLNAARVPLESALYAR